MTGATGFIGGRLTDALLDSGMRVRILVRDPARAARFAGREGCEVVKGDVTDEASLQGIGRDVDVAYYLVHAMAGGSGYEQREHEGALNFARAAKREGIAGSSISEGWATRASPNTCRVVTTQHGRWPRGPPLTYFRAAMVVGSESESYRTLRYLVKRLPIMIAPSWLRSDTQPIAVEDVVEYLRRAPEVPESEGREVQIGGPDVLSYGEMLDGMARAMGLRPRPKLPTPFITPWLSSLWLGLVTPVDTNVARPLVEGLQTDTVVLDPSGAAPFGIEPISFAESLKRALQEDEAESSS